MPGSSLWLTPPPSHPLHAILTKLIETSIPAHFPHTTPRPPIFSPHMTLTSNVNPSIYADQPQEWLDGIAFPPASEVDVEFERVKTEDVYYRRCYIKCAFEGVKDVAAIARARGVEGEAEVGEKTKAWLVEWKEAFGPHVSLMYGDMTIDEAKLNEVERIVRESGVSFREPSGENTGWKGGVVWLVPTDKNIAEWKPIATRTL
ncbi:2',3'-cyclic-nucleotide 3'-phosphodiesterase [Cytospora mali]|uniref:2',3'-cyclic-nucleotide 3'-phosphodiesterase n=1 Tax=Cytospora mali TaxID=578113 RepID=A0A194V7U5_CYTMA|nr:2',3'-cyclic-nucleotide 3'-phosphodiesterase [Valsa mali var. pyri (nom. inval.)]